MIWTFDEAHCSRFGAATGEAGACETCGGLRWAVGLGRGGVGANAATLSLLIPCSIFGSSGKNIEANDVYDSVAQEALSTTTTSSDKRETISSPQKALTFWTSLPKRACSRSRSATVIVCFPLSSGAL